MSVAPSRSAVPFFDEAAVRRVLHMEALIPAMERALVDFSTGKVTQPVRSVIPIEQHSGLMGIMPVVYGEVMGAKLVTFYRNNGARGLPTHMALIALFRSDTGEPIAIMDGRLITEMRTAAVSAVAVNLLSSPGAKRLALLGSGVQARAHAQALNLVRPISEICVWSRNPAHARQCAEEIGASATHTAEEAVRNADIVVTITSADEPILRGTWLQTTALVLAVGAIGPTRREVDSDVMRGAVIVDSRDAAQQESGDILLAGAPIYAELGELLAGRKRKPMENTIVFKSLGLAVEDLAAARLVLEAA